MKTLEIPITTPQNPLKCHNILTQLKKEKIKLSPTFCLEFLQSTNNRKNISDFLDILDEHIRKTPQEYPTYRAFVYGILPQREQPESIREKAVEMIVQYTNLQSLDKEDRKIITALRNINISKELTDKVEKLATVIYEKMPMNVCDIAEEITEKVINERKGASEISNFIIQELPEKKKKNIFKRIVNKVQGR